LIQPYKVLIMVKQSNKYRSAIRRYLVPCHSVSSYRRRAFAVAIHNCLEVNEQWSAWSSA